MAERNDEWRVRVTAFSALVNDAYGGDHAIAFVYVDQRDPAAALEAIAHRLNTYDALVAALEKLASGSPPDDWVPLSRWGDPQEYGKPGQPGYVEAGDRDSLSDHHTHGVAVGKWEAARVARAALRLVKGE